VSWYLDDYVSLDREQQARFDERLDRLCWSGTVVKSYLHMWSCSMMHRPFSMNGVPLDDTRAMADRIEEAAIRFQDPFLELLLSTGEDLRPDQEQRLWPF
jgi:hypothetical protein